MGISKCCAKCRNRFTISDPDEYDIKLCFTCRMRSQNITIEEIHSAVLKDARKYIHDRRHYARRLRDQVKFHKYGYSKTIPLEWKKYINQLEEEKQQERKNTLGLSAKLLSVFRNIKNAWSIYARN